MIKNNFILLNNPKKDFSQFSYYEPNENHSINKNNSIMGNYTLCSLYDQITILVDDIINWKIDNKSLLNFFDNMIEQTLKDFQFIFILPKDSKYKYLMNLIRGKFIMILEKFIMFEKNEFEKLISLTNGKIDNIFESHIQNNSLYIINI